MLLILAGSLGLTGVILLTLGRVGVNILLVQACTETRAVSPYSWHIVFSDIVWGIPFTIGILVGVALCTAKVQLRISDLWLTGAEKLADRGNRSHA
jgi:hypothetical protein